MAHRRRIALLAGLASACLVVAAPAQEQDTPKPPRQQAMAPQSSSDDQAWLKGPLVTFEFGGGTVQEYVQALRQSAKKPVNVAVASNAAGVKLPSISMQSVYLQDALEAIQWVSELPPDQRVGVTNLTRPMAVQPGVQLPNTAAFAVVLDDPARRGGRQPTPGTPAGRTTSVLSIGDVLGGRGGGLDPRTVLGAVETALQMAAGGGGEQPELKFHQDSSMLIVRGDQDSVRVVHQVIEEIRGDLKRRRGERERAQVEARELLGAVRTAEINYQTAKSRLSFRNRQLDQATKLLEQGTIPPQDVMRMEMEREEAAADVARAEVALDLANQRARSAELEQPPAAPAPAKER